MFSVEVTAHLTVLTKIFMRSSLQNCAATLPSSEGQGSRGKGHRVIDIEAKTMDTSTAVFTVTVKKDGGGVPSPPIKATARIHVDSGRLFLC